MKKCSTCKNEKALTEFAKRKANKDGYNGQCKKCRHEWLVDYRSKNRDKILARRNEWKLKNKDRVDEVNRKYYEDNIDKIKLTRKVQWQKYYSDNKDALLEKNKVYKSKNLKRRREINSIRRKEDPIFNLRQTLSSRTAKAFTVKGYNKRTKTFDMLGCDWNIAKEHIERQFAKGMSWDNRSEWHIDHKIPLSSAKNKDELKALCHYTNLQPLWAIDNITKGDKVNYDEKKRYLATNFKRICK